MQVFAFCRPIYVSQFDAHLANQQAVVLISPVNPNVIIHLWGRERKTLTVMLNKNVSTEEILPWDTLWFSYLTKSQV